MHVFLRLSFIGFNMTVKQQTRFCAPEQYSYRFTICIYDKRRVLISFQVIFFDKFVNSSSRILGSCGETTLTRAKWRE